MRVVLVVAVLAGLLGLVGPTPGAHAKAERTSSLQLEGRVVVLDAGHQLGNQNFPKKISRLVPAGGFKKACNTTGTESRRGLAEATFVWRVSRLVRARLEKAGARVIFTRHSNRLDRWGPCVDERGRAGNRAEADVKLSIHADGVAQAGARGFHVISPTDRPKWTHDIVRPSARFARVVKAGLRSVGLRVATYTAGGDGLVRRGDLGTLNLSDVPTAMVEVGNMRNRRDAHRMSTRHGRVVYARALTRAVRSFLAS
jgi:N-acetylmuramoyl-L-alanine amidase